MPLLTSILALQSGGDDFVEQLVKFGFLILFLLLPAARSILDKKARGAKGEPKTPRPKPVDTRRGRTLWEMLEQGEEVDTPAPPVVERDTEVPTSSRPAPISRPELRPGSGWSVEPESEPVHATGEQPGAGRTPTTETASFEPTTSTATFEPTTEAATFESDLEPALDPDSESDAVKPAFDYLIADQRQIRRDKGSSAMRWRRAILVHEVLGPPVALRQAPDPIGPAGLQ